MALMKKLIIWMVSTYSIRIIKFINKVRFLFIFGKILKKCAFEQTENLPPYDIPGMLHESYCLYTYTLRRFALHLLNHMLPYQSHAFYSFTR